MNRRIAGCAVVIAALLLLPPGSPPAQGRPQYKKIFFELYEKELGSTEGSNSCTVCHAESSKRVRNNYGDAVKETLAKNNLDDRAKLEAALRAAENKPSAIEAKTFGDLIKAGKLPASKK